MESRSLKRSDAWEWLVGIIGLGVAVWQVPQFGRLPALEIVFLLALGLVLEFFPVNTGKAQGSLIYIVPLALVVGYSASAAICVTVVAELLAPIRKDQRRRLSTWVFNAGQYGLSAYAMTVAYAFVAGTGVYSTLNLTTLAGLGIATVVFLVVNHLFIHFIYFTRGSFEQRDVLNLFRTDGVNFLAVIPFVLLFILASGPYQVWAPLMMLPVALVSQVVRMYRRLSITSEIHTALLRLTGEFDIDTISQQIAETATKVTYADAVAVFIMNDTGDMLIPTNVYPTAAAEDFSLDGLRKSNGGVIWSIVDSGTWSYVPNVHKDNRVRYDGVGGRDYWSMAVFPMQTRGETQGAIVIYSLIPYAFSEFLAHTQVLASQVAVLVENAKLYQQLQEQSCRDGATGLYNYRFLYEELGRQLMIARSAQQDFSVAVVDIDSFKKFNDTYGHLAGDAVLKSLATLLKEVAGPDATVARYGGEEFAILFPLPVRAAFERVEAIRNSVVRHVVDFDGYRLQGITLSCGLAGFPQHAMDDRDLLLKADSAMYWGAKQRGRNRTALYAPEFDAQLFVDELTGLYTYHFVNIRVREELERGIHNWGVLCLDLENVSFINSTFGFEAGDQVLRECSTLLRECLRSNELACRFGGDEFLVLLPGVAEGELNSVSDRLQRAIQGHRFKFKSNVMISVHVRKCAGSFSDVLEPGTLFEQVGRLFAEMNTREVADGTSV